MTTTQKIRADAAEAALLRVLGTDAVPAGKARRIDQVKYSFSQLRTWYDPLWRRAVETIPGVTATDIDEVANKLRFGVLDPTVDGALLRGLADQFGVPEDALLVVQKGVPRVGGTVQDYWRPVVGGLQVARAINATDDYVCSLGASGVRAGSTGFVINTHCSSIVGQADGSDFGQNTSDFKIGDELIDPPFFSGGACPGGKVCRYSESIFVKFSIAQSGYQLGKIAKLACCTLNWDGIAKWTVTSESQSGLGQGLTKVGRTTGQTTGFVERRCENEIYPEIPNGYLLCQYVTSTPFYTGDSGSALIRSEGGGGNNVALKGVYWGMLIDGQAEFIEGYYSPIVAVQAASELGPINFCSPGGTC